MHNPDPASLDRIPLMGSWPIIGHEWALELLERAALAQRPSHAILLSGPSQIGKTTLARALAQALCCELAKGAPCLECRTCQRIAEGRFPDVQVIAAEKNTIQIEQIRALQLDAATSPLEGRWKIFIIREIERATLPAANALLKTLEEPPPRVLLIVTSSQRDRLLPTIVSRCQLLALRPLPLQQVRDALESTWGVESERAALLARLSAGRLGWAVTAHREPEIWPTRSRRLDDLLTLSTSDPLARLAYSESLSKQGVEIESTLALWTSWWRDIMLVQHGLDEAIINIDRRTQLKLQADLYELSAVTAALADLTASLTRLKANVNARLLLDVLLLRLPAPSVA